MSKNHKKIYLIEIILIAIFAICTLFSLTINKIFTAGMLVVSAIVVSLLLKRNVILKTNKKKILIIMVVFGIIYIALFYMLGIYTGFYHQTNSFGIKTLFKYIIPITMIIISTEIIRNKLLLDSSTKSKILVIIFGTLVDISIYLDVYGLSNLESFLGLVGFVSFASLANNLLFTYISPKYGKEPIIAYRLITILYIYIIPIAPDVYIFFRAFARMIYPLLIYTYIDKYYNLDKYRERPIDLRNQVITIAVGSILMIIIICLISCKFLFGVLVIGSESMSSSIEKGDVVFFISKKDKIKSKDIIVFKREDVKIVHRVVKIKKVNGNFWYYTKGDANQIQDDGYVTKDTLVGKVLFKIKYIGKPTLWLRSLFDKEG